MTICNQMMITVTDNPLSVLTFHRANAFRQVHVCQQALTGEYRTVNVPFDTCQISQVIYGSLFCSSWTGINIKNFRFTVLYIGYSRP